MNIKKLILVGTILAVIMTYFTACAGAKPKITVYKNPSCGCCAAWANHLRENGFEVTVIESSTVAEVRNELGVPERLTSCHTAQVGGYAIEGHVPASSIKRLLNEKPAVIGLSVLGMPVGSPGMEQGGAHDPYKVVSFSKDGSTAVFDSFD